MQLFLPIVACCGHMRLLKVLSCSVNMMSSLPIKLQQPVKHLKITLISVTCLLTVMLCNTKGNYTKEF